MPGQAKTLAQAHAEHVADGAMVAWRGRHSVLVLLPRAAFLGAVQAQPPRLACVLVARSEGAGAAFLQMSQADPADMLGVTRQSLNGELKNLERAGIVALARNRNDVCDRAALGRLAGSGD